MPDITFSPTAGDATRVADALKVYWPDLSGTDEAVIKAGIQRWTSSLVKKAEDETAAVAARDAVTVANDILK